MAEEEDGDALTLSASTFAALNEFYQEQDQRERAREEAAGGKCQDDDHGEPESMDEFAEDWQLSQFWYDDATARALARECARVAAEAGPEAKVACLSCPTLFVALRRHCPELGDRVKLFEHDRRFARFGKNFVFYDYKAPLDVPRDMREKFDIVFADPPFLSEECLTKTAVTIKFLARDKIILCSGAVMAELAGRLLSLEACRFAPGHRNNLANEFRCYANYDLDEHVLRPDDEDSSTKSSS